MLWRVIDPVLLTKKDHPMAVQNVSEEVANRYSGQSTEVFRPLGPVGIPGAVYFRVGYHQS